MKGVILAAGQGKRMGSLTATTPKSLVPILGRPILDFQLEALESVGIKEIFVVTGFQATALDQYLHNRAKTIFNAKFAETNSLYSLSLVRNWVDGCDFILLNGDMVVDSALIHQLIRCPESCAALVNRQKEFRDGEMNVRIKDGVIREFSKEIPGTQADGESAQITKFGKRESSLLFSEIERIISSGDTLGFPAQAYQVIFDQSVMVPVDSEGHWHFEIDTLEDYQVCCDFFRRKDKNL